jgi:hypothetical protein
LGTLSFYLTKRARLGGYLVRASDPPPSNVVICRLGRWSGAVMSWVSGQAYSDDLRARVLAAVDRGGRGASSTVISTRWSHV